MLGILIVFAVIVEPRQGKEIQPYGNFVSAQTLAEGMDGKIDVAEHESSACATGKTLVDRSDLCGRLPFPQYRLKAMQCPNYRSESYISTGGGTGPAPAASGHVLEASQSETSTRECLARRLQSEVSQKVALRFACEAPGG